MIRGIRQIERLGFACKKSSKRSCSSLIQPIYANRCIVDVRRRSRSIKVLQQIDIHVAESALAQYTSDLRRHIVELSAALEGQAYDILDELQLRLAAVRSVSCLGIVIANGGVRRSLSGYGPEQEGQGSDRSGEL